MRVARQFKFSNLQTILEIEHGRQMIRVPRQMRGRLVIVIPGNIADGKLPETWVRTSDPYGTISH